MVCVCNMINFWSEYVQFKSSEELTMFIGGGQQSPGKSPCGGAGPKPCKYIPVNDWYRSSFRQQTDFRQFKPCFTVKKKATVS